MAGDGGVAVGGDVGVYVTIGIPPEVLEVVVRGLTSPDPAARRGALALLRAQVPEGQESMRRRGPPSCGAGR